MTQLSQLRANGYASRSDGGFEIPRQRLPSWEAEISEFDIPRKRDGITFWKVVLFAMGACVWVFKLDRSAKMTPNLDPILPVSPLQVLVPVFGMLALGLMMFSRRSDFRHRMTSASLFYVLGTLLIVTGGACHLFVGDDLAGPFAFVLRWLMPAQAFLCFFWIRSRGYDFSPVMLGIAFGAIVSVVGVELLRVGFPIPATQMQAARFGGFLYHPNQYGIVAASTSGIIVYFVASQLRWQRLLGLILIPVYMLIMFQCLSKTNIVLMMLALCVLTGIMAMRTFRSFVICLIAALFLLAIAGFFAENVFRVLENVGAKEAQSLENAVEMGSESSTMKERYQLWEEAAGLIERNPFFGIGPGVSEQYLPVGHAHNLFLQIYLDAGPLGELGAWLILLTVARCTWMSGTQLFLSSPTSIHRSEILLTTAAGIGCSTYLLGNMMSDSFNTATLSAFVVLAGILFTNARARDMDSSEREMI